METIKNYLDTMFTGLPKTADIIKLKEDLLCNMEDKYNELKQNGKSENEAIGIVISEFGNIDELARELDIDINTNSREDLLPLVTLQQAEKILHDKKLYGSIIAFGVFLCIMAPAIFIIISMGLGSSFDTMEQISPLPLFPFFMMIAFAVALFIFSGLQLQKYDYLEKPFNLDYNVKTFVTDKKERFQMFFILQIIIGVMLCILSPLTIITLQFMDTSNDMYQGIGVFLLLTFIAIGVFLFIHAGTIMNSYKELLQEEEYTRQNKENNRLVDAVAAVVWPIVTAGYLLWSFISGDWGFTWIVWPIAGILFGSFSAVCQIVCGRNK